MLVGDAAGLAYAHSGEGIRPAIESGLLAASTIIEARHRYGRDRLMAYENGLCERFGNSRRLPRFTPRHVTSRLGRSVAPWLLRMPWFVRHVVLDRWFLHAYEPALGVA